MTTWHLAGAARIGRRRAAWGLAGMTLVLALSGCATTGAESPQAAAEPGASVTNPADPFESYNRSMYRFNTAVDDAVLKPVATVYRDVTPAVARQGVGNFFANLDDFWSFFNNLLQGRGEGAYNSMVRFSVNTVFGLGGLLDIASEMGVDRKPQDFGLTLGRWGVPAGPYLVLPLLGPSTVRDTAAMPVEWADDVIFHATEVRLRNSLVTLDLVDKRARLLKAGDMLDAVALDKYSLTRDVFLQMRNQRARGDSQGLVEELDDEDAGRLPPEE